MKIEIELPDWKEDEYKDWFIIAGSELRAYYRFNEKKWNIKTVQCNQCGKCCMDMAPGHYPLDENNNCIHLDMSDKSGKTAPCKLGKNRPISCVVGEPNQKGIKDFCSVRYNGE